MYNLIVLSIQLHNLLITCSLHLHVEKILKCIMCSNSINVRKIILIMLISHVFQL